MRNKLTALAIAAVLVAGCGSSGSTTASTSTTSDAALAGAEKAALLTLCARALRDYQTLGKDIADLGANPADTTAYGPAVAADATLKTDLVELRPHGDAGQQAQTDQYTTVLTQLGQALQTAAGGDFQAANGQITGVAQQVGQIPALVGAICPTP